MKTKLIIFLLIGILFSMTNAQAQTDTLKIFKTNALQFRVYDFISLSSFKGALISYKYHLNDQNAFRVGVSVRVDLSDEQETRDVFFTDTSLFDQKRKINGTSIQFSVEYLKYLNPQDEIKLFFGFGPRFDIYIYNVDTDEITTSGNAYGYDKKRINDRYQFGLTGSLGVEWFFMKNMSLHAEYGFYAYYFYDKNHRITVYEYSTGPNRYDDRKVESDGWGFDDAGALFGLSVYF